MYILKIKTFAYLIKLILRTHLFFKQKKSKRLINNNLIKHCSNFVQICLFVFQIFDLFNNNINIKINIRCQKEHAQILFYFQKCFFVFNLLHNSKTNLFFSKIDRVSKIYM